ncbi:MAG: DUF2794 domain-containing protein, partial [Hyphomicrobiales bacterium]
MESMLALAQTSRHLIVTIVKNFGRIFMADMNDNSSASNRRHAESTPGAQIHSFPTDKTTSNQTSPLNKANYKQVTFNRTELNAILRIYGFMVAAGEWRDYAIDHLKD